MGAIRLDDTVEIVSDEFIAHPLVIWNRTNASFVLAIRSERLIGEGEIADYSELARLGHVTRARVTQIMNMLLLAPDIQEAILYLPRVESGDDLIVLRNLQAIAGEVAWGKQRLVWPDCST